MKKSIPNDSLDINFNLKKDNLFDDLLHKLNYLNLNEIIDRPEVKRAMLNLAMKKYIKIGFGKKPMKRTHPMLYRKKFKKPKENPREKNPRK